jgi:hypothetical protein
MDLNNLPETIAAVAFFGFLVVCPLAYVFLKHQREMAAIIHGRGHDETQRRIEALEREIALLRAERALPAESVEQRLN